MRRSLAARGRSQGTGYGRRSALAKVMDVLLAVAILGLLALISMRLERFSTIEPAGVARVADGDSLELAGERIRLRGIDAPELSQTCRKGGADYPCGRLAREALLKLTDGKPISCQGWERDRYGRLLATCSTGGLELNRRLVADGWALAYGGYAAEEAEARAAKLGIWAGEFDRPGDWRVSHGELAETPHDMFGAVANWLRQLFAP